MGLRVTVLLGGASDERDVSFATGVQVARALRARGLEVGCLDTAVGPVSRDEEDRVLREGVPPAPPVGGLRDLLVEGGVAWLDDFGADGAPDVFFVALHGGAGEDGRVQAVLEAAGRVYTGSDAHACRIAMDKGVTKEILREEGIPTPPWLMDVFSPDDIQDALGLPVILKAASGGSSLRLELAHDRAELEVAVERARHFDDRVLAEGYVAGREFTVGILEDRALPVGEIIPRGEFFDYECKYQPGMALEVFPAELEGEKAGEMQDLALRVHGALGLRDYSRVDFIMGGDGGMWCLEANTLPGLTANSLVPKAAAAAGMAFEDLCARLVELAASRGARR
jgi:D-alanine-D-alanine ligase